MGWRSSSTGAAVMRAFAGRVVAMRGLISPLVAAWALVVMAAGPAGAEVAIVDGAVESERHRYTPGAMGLPRQVVVSPTESELPLEARGEGAEAPGEGELVWMGRGPRLAGAVELVGIVNGERKAAEASRTGEPALRDGVAVVEGEGAVGAYKVATRIRYGEDGRIGFDIATSRADADAGPLMVDVPLAGRVNLLFTGLPKDFAVGETRAEAVKATLPTRGEAGEAWASEAGVGAGKLPRLYVGSPDAGFVFEADNDWSVGQATGLVSVHQDELGMTRLRIMLRSGEATGARRHRFTLRALPTGSKPEGHRRRGWLDWPDDMAEPLDAGNGEADWPFDGEAGGYRALSGIGAAIASVERDHVASYPNSLMQVLLGPATGRAARLEPNFRDVLRGRADLPGKGRQIMGRALLHDAAVDGRGLAQPVEALRTIAALRAFGYFEPTGTEFIPYWRTGEIVRYGEAYDPNSAFNLSAKNPARDTFVSVYRRPIERDGRPGVAAMFIIMNQQPSPVRAKLYVLKPERIFGAGGRSRLKARDALDRVDFSAIPEGSDWRREKISRYADATGLMDLEEDSPVIEASGKGLTARVYGPIHIGARDYRVLYGHWIEGADENR